MASRRPGASGRELPDTEVIALTSVLEDNSVVGAVKAGAIGYLLKDTQAEELCRAIKAAAAGQVQLSPQAAARLVREVRAPDSPQTLTEREVDVLRLIAQGKANKEIAVCADHRREDREDARQQHSHEAGRAEPHASGALCRADWHGSDRHALRDGAAACASSLAAWAPSSTSRCSSSCCCSARRRHRWCCWASSARKTMRSSEARRRSKIRANSRCRR